MRRARPSPATGRSPASVVAAVPAGSLRIASDLGGLRADLVGGGARRRPRARAPAPTRSGTADRPLERPHAAHRAAEHGGEAVDAERGRPAAPRPRTWSRIGDAREPRSPRPPVRGRDDGPVVPWQPPSTLAATTNQSVGVERAARPDHAVPPARGRLARARPGPATCASPVSACSTSTALVIAPSASRRGVPTSRRPPGRRAARPPSSRSSGPRSAKPARRRRDRRRATPRHASARPWRRGTRRRGRRGCRRCSRCRPPAAPGPGVTPVASCSSGDSCECVVDAGWMTRLRTSPMLATWLCSSSASTKRLPASTPPAISKASTPPTPRGAYFCARSCHGLDGRPA